MHIRLLLCGLTAAVCIAWHEPHITITRAAIRSLPETLRTFLRGETETIAQLYSFYPDRYRNASPAEKAFMQRFCELPDGKQIHNVTWDKARDIESVEYLFDGILTSLRAGEPADMARYAGTLAHLLEDSLSPAHAMDLRLLQELVPPPEHARKLYVHAPMELSCPDFSLEGRTPRRLGTTVPEAARQVIDACYAGIRKNRADLIELLQAVYRNDLPVMDKLRLAAARTAAEQYADAMYTVLTLARERDIAPPPKGRQHEPPTSATSGLHVEINNRLQSTAAVRGAALNVAFALREAARSLAIDKRVLRTELGRVLIRIPRRTDSTCVEILGDWPPHSGSQVTEFCLDAGGNIAAVGTKLDGVPDSGRQQRPFGQWIRTVDHRGDPLFEVEASSNVLSLRNHKGVVASLNPSRQSFGDGVVLNIGAAAPVSVQVTEHEGRVHVGVSGQPPQTIGSPIRPE